MHPLGKAALGLASVGAAGLAYSAGYEVNAFRVREVEIPCLPPGRPTLRALHLSDIHITPSQHRKAAWLRTLADFGPDLIINTGDNLSHLDAVPVVMDALGELRDVPGVYVFGSNDYWAPVLKNPLRYFLPAGGKKKITGPPLPWRDLRQAFNNAGWLDLSNRFGSLTVGGTRFAFAGVDDPHLKYDKLDAVSGRADPTADVRIGVTHAPYLRVLDAFTRDGYGTIFAGHTHGGQLRVPGYGSLVTNCDIDNSRSRGLHTHTVADRSSWLHVSAGVGTSPYAPIRFACFPEATLVSLTPAPERRRRNRI